MRSTHTLLPAVVLLLLAAAASGQSVPLAQRIGHYVAPTSQPPRRESGKGPHQGVGSLAFMNPLDLKYVQGNWGFFQRGVLYGQSSIGEHWHTGTEEMFVILEGDAQYTMDGRTSLIKGPAAVPVRLTHAHALYNPTDQPMQWMNLSVSAKNGGGTFENGDARAGNDIALDRVPQFIFMRLDRTLLYPVQRMDGGTGSVLYRRAFGPGTFSTLWSYTDHFLVNAGASMGSVTKADISEIYYVVAGAGTVTVNSETAPIKTGDVVPVDYGQSRSFNQAGSEPLELFVNAVSRNTAVKEAITLPYPVPAK